jgi:hypothetical protein
MLTQTEIERERYEARLKGMHDQSCLLFGARQIGKFIGRIHICQLLLKEPQTAEEELEQLAPGELSRRADQLLQKVLTLAPESEQPIVVPADHPSTRTHLP